MTQNLILKSFQSPGDIVMLSAAVRDLHRAYPGRFATDVRTSADAIWQHNPYLTHLREGDAGVGVLDMHYPAIHQSNQRPYHFLHGYVQFLEQRFDLRIPVTKFAGDIHLSETEKQSTPPHTDLGVPERYWIIVAGSKLDFTCKRWVPASYQAVVDHFRGRLDFVQCGEAGHWHPRLQGAIDLVGKTTLREFIRLMYHAAGIVCPVTLAMHLAAAVETKPGHRKLRPCVVVAGGREPPHWEAYPHHQFLHTVGTLSCCAEGGCWRSRCQRIYDGDPKDHHNLCLFPVQVQPDLCIPQCMATILPEDVIRRIELYCDAAGTGTADLGIAAPQGEAPHEEVRTDSVQPSPVPVLIDFRHGLGDAVQLTSVLQHLRHYHPEWCIDVAALGGKHSAYGGLCRRALVRDRDHVDRSQYERYYSLDWDECRNAYGGWPSTKVARCLLEVFQLTPLPELCTYNITCSERAQHLAKDYLHQITGAEPDTQGQYPVTLIHYEGNTSGQDKNLSHELARTVCEVAAAAGTTPVILDWDRRSPLPDGLRILNPGAEHPLWEGRGTGDAEILATLIDAARLMIGVDSGPLHVAGATRTPTIAVWTNHHPVHYFDLADNVLHLVPSNHPQLVHGPQALEFFQSHYRHHVYQQLSIDLPAMVESLLTSESFDRIANRRFLQRLSARAYDEHYYEEHKLAGLDYLGFGLWQQEYGRWLVDSLQLKGQRVLDVGCACGSILRGLRQAGAMAQGIDLSEHMVELGRRQWPDMAPLLRVCDAVNLHLFADGCWDAVHSAQVAEHWKAELVPYILGELRRIVTPGGLFFCTLDTEELFQRQGRVQEQEDPTHVCIRPLHWWHEQLDQAGWQLCSQEYLPALSDHPDSFLKRYDWDWFLARRR